MKIVISKLLSSKVKRILRILIGLTIFLIIYYKIGFQNVFDTLLSVNFVFLFLGIFFLFVSFYISALNLKILTNVIRKVPMLTMLKYYLQSWALGLIAPGKLGELSLAYFLRKHNMSLGEGIAISITDKLITIFVLCLLSILGFFIFFNSRTALYASFIVILVFVSTLLLIANHTIRRLIRKYVLRKYENKFKGFYRLLQKITSQKKILFLNIGLTFLKWMFSAIVILFLFHSLNVTLYFIDVLIVSAITVIVSLIPVTISGLGTREVSAVYLYSLIGVDLRITATVFLLMNFINYILAALIFFILKEGGRVT